MDVKTSDIVESLYSKALHTFKDPSATPLTMLIAVSRAGAFAQVLEDGRKMEFCEREVDRIRRNILGIK